MTQATINPAALDASNAHCAAVTRSRARNFFHGLRLCKPDHRKALFAVYAWTRAADDITDQPDHPPAQRHTALDTFEEATARVLDGTHVPDHDFWPAFAHAVHTFPIEHLQLERLIEGLRWDLDVGNCQTNDDLTWYASRVASTVGVICTSVWAPRTPDAQEESRRLAYIRGQAFQLTNILRDLREDLTGQPPRSYLPQQSFDQFGITQPELLEWSKPEACSEFMDHWIARAKRDFARSANYEKTINPAGVAASTAMHDIYRELLERIARDPRAAVRARVTIPTARKVLVGLKAARRYAR